MLKPKDKQVFVLNRDL